VKEVDFLQINKVDRFESFILLIDAIHKSINKIKTDIAPESAIKSVHTMWLYELLRHPEGLTATEIAAKTMIDRSLVSREISALMRGGYVKCASSEGKRNYNSVITLTDMGKILAEEIAGSALEIQDKVSQNVDKDELFTFYSVLERLYRNIEEISNKRTPCEAN
jgi:DNA-binding MarR family transcriptional regulator